MTLLTHFLAAMAGSFMTAIAMGAAATRKALSAAKTSLAGE